jgi:disulfide bond formation protein DsbB
MYSQVVLLGVALYRRDFGVWIYSIALSLAGVFFAGYHYYLHFRKLIGLPELPCGGGLVPSCSEIQAINFGYITMPLMSLTIFATLITLMVILRRQTAR